MKGRIMRNEPINRISLPIIGKIKVGIKDEKGLPKSIDYFVSTGKYAGLFNQAYGDKPQTIQIVFVYDEPGKSCKEEYQYRVMRVNWLHTATGNVLCMERETICTIQYKRLSRFNGRRCAKTPKPGC